MVTQCCARQGCKGQRAEDALPAPAAPADHRAAAQNSTRSRLPDSEMVFGNGKFEFGERYSNIAAVEPCGGHEATDGFAGNVLQQGGTAAHQPNRDGTLETEELAFPSSEMAGLEPVKKPAVH